MTYRKFKADYLFTGREMADRDAVLITTEDGTIQDILPISEAGEDIRHVNGILSPGFINCHCHLELSHLKGVLPERTGLVDFLLAVMQQRNAGPPTSVSGQTGASAPGSTGTSVPGISPSSGTPGFIQTAIAEAEAYMLTGGIVAVGDICNTTDTLVQKTAGHLYYHNFIETMGFIEQTAPDRFENSRKIFDAFVAATTQKNTSLVPHAPYSVSSRLFGLIAGFPDNHLLTIHNQETAAENKFYLSGKGDFLRLYQAMGIDTSFFKGTGKRSLESYLPYFYRYHGQEPTAPLESKDNSGSKDSRLPSATTANGHFPQDPQHNRRRSMILVHNVATSEEDLQFALKGLSAGRQEQPSAITQQPTDRLSSTIRQQSPDLFFCLCPNANLYIGGELPDITLLVRMNSTIVIGTDSLASNHQLSILEELKTLQRQLPQLPTHTLLQWATANGAEALQMDDILGSFTPGKRPGVLLIEHMEGDKFKADTQVRRLI
jgi:cytosine/adenosine deaminase-related metal-dependent hydrolase